MMSDNDIIDKLFDDSIDIDYKFTLYTKIDDKSCINDLLIYSGDEDLSNFLEIYYGLGEVLCKKFKYSDLIDYYVNFYLKVKNKRKLKDTLVDKIRPSIFLNGRLSFLEVYFLYFTDKDPKSVNPMLFGVNYISKDEFIKNKDILNKYLNYTIFFLYDTVKLKRDNTNFLIAK